MSRLNGFYRPAAVALLALVAGSSAQGAPPWLQGFGAYRVVDATGRIAPKTEVAGSGRVVMRPVYPVSPLLRPKLFFPQGYAGAAYGKRRGYDPTSFHTHGHGHAHPAQ